MPSFNFLDGSGPVLAHRHKNPDGSLGGWVADTAFVEVGVHVGPDVMVYGQAKVWDNAVLSGKTRVFGQAVISGSAKISDEAWVIDQAIVTNQAELSGDILVFGQARISGNLGSVKE